MAIDFKHINYEFIENWCIEHKETAWLKLELSLKEPVKVYPRKKTINENGKKVSVADKSKPYTVEMKPVSFITVKRRFCEVFMPEVLPVKQEKPKKPSMRDRVANL